MICRTHRFSGVEDAEHGVPAIQKVLNVGVQLSYSTPRRRWVDLPVKTDGRPGGRKSCRVPLFRNGCV
jgi:hypothetical protein